MRPTEGSASVLNAEGEKSRSVNAQAVQRSVKATVTILPWSVEWEDGYSCPSKRRQEKTYNGR
jgi:hypothetical protein